MNEEVDYLLVRNEVLVAFHALDRATCHIQRKTGEQLMGDAIESLEGDDRQLLIDLTNALSYLDNFPLGYLTEKHPLSE